MNIQSPFPAVSARCSFMSRRPRMIVASPAAMTTITTLGILAVSGCFDVALAQSVTGGLSATTMLVNICNFILGAFGQTLSILGIMVIGLSWMFGRASTGLIAGVIGGIVLMYGASYLGKTLLGT